MFLRRFEKRRRGKVHSYWALVESYRTAQGSRQRIVAYLGELQPSEQSGWAKLGRRLDGRAKPQPSLFDPPAPDDPTETALVDLRGVRLERLRDFGDVWLSLGLWRLLGLDGLLAKLLPAGKEEVPWPLVAAILVCARFCEPASELHIEHTWYRRTALEDLLGVAVDKVHTDRLYAGLDKLLPHKDALERHLKERLGDLFDLDYDVLLYDVTSTYFEGQCEANEQAKRGYSRDGKSQCLQVCIGLVVTPDGIPLGHEVFAGNTHDSKTLKTMMAAIEKKYGKARRVWVMDRGMVSEANLTELRVSGASYIVGTPKAMLRRFEKQLLEEGWQTAQEGVEVKLVAAPDGVETFVLARSKDRRSKEKAIHAKFLVRMQEGLEKLKAAADSGRLKDLAVANRRLGRLLQKNSRAAGAFDVVVQRLPPPKPIPARKPIVKETSTPAASEPTPAKAASNATAEPSSINPAPTPKPMIESTTRQAKNVGGAAKTKTAVPQLSVAWTRNQDWHDWAALAEGCYLLRSNLADVDAATLWKRYIQLTEAEWAFRITKDELRIRPIFHQLETRAKAHILICFLAFVLWKTLAQWMQRAGLGEAPRPLVAELAKIKSGDVVLPTKNFDGKADASIRLRCVTNPDEAQKILLHRLGLNLPSRLRTTTTETNM